MSGERPWSERGPGDASLPTTALVAFAVGAALGFAVSSQRGRRGEDVRELVDDLIRAAMDGALASGTQNLVLDTAVERLRAFGERARNGWPS